MRYDGSAVARYLRESPIWTRKLEITLWIGMMIVGFFYSLEQNTSYLYLSHATSDLGQHASLATIQTAQSLIMAVGKPVVAKVSDKIGRAEAYLYSVAFYAAGYAIVVCARNVGVFGLGLLVYAVGYTGLQCIQSIVCADLTTLRWRQLGSAIIYIWFILNCFVAGKFAETVITNLGWKWGYGIFIITMPLATLPVIVTLLYAQFSTKKMLKERDGASAEEKKTRTAKSIFAKWMRGAEEIDAIGLILLGGGVGLILLPCTKASVWGWISVRVITLLCLGVTALTAFVFWESFYAKMPIFTKEMLRTRNIIGYYLLEFFDFLSFYLTFAYLYSYIIVTRDLSISYIGYMIYTQSVCLTIGALLSGALMTYTKDYYWISIVGTGIRLIGVGLMIPLRGPVSSLVGLVTCQVLQGIGGGLNNAASVGAQAVVTHSKVAIVIAVALIAAELGGAFGTATAGVIWSSIVPNKMNTYLADRLTAEEINNLYNSALSAREYELDDPIRQGVIRAFGEGMAIMNWAALAVGCIPFLLLIFVMQNIKADDRMNAVENPNENELAAIAQKPESPLETTVSSRV